jgi:hypothetical protein
VTIPSRSLFNAQLSLIVSAPYVKEASQLRVLHRPGKHKIRSRFNRRPPRSSSVHDGDDHRLLAGATAAHLGEHIGTSRDIVTVNDEAIETAASWEFDGTCSICA